ncbi:hypothetical protein JHK84_049747 [Glycine max]|nr:hypothetical protein JHK86_049710 [Glycine max]KAG5094159.1 hypothetical protein JHK84_049747 [Glycine max]
MAQGREEKKPLNAREKGKGVDEGFHPKLADFGLAKFGPTGEQSYVATRVMRTQGYCAPKYATSGNLTMRSDIYSFGVVLLELITGRRAYDDNGGNMQHTSESQESTLFVRENVGMVFTSSGGRYAHFSYLI